MVKERANELMYSCADIAELEKIGWKREFSLVDALTEIIEEEGNEAFNYRWMWLSWE